MSKPVKSCCLIEIFPCKNKILRTLNYLGQDCTFLKAGKQEKCGLFLKYMVCASKNTEQNISFSHNV